MKNAPQRPSRAPGTSSYAWSSLRPAFTTAYRESPRVGLAFCEQWIVQLETLLLNADAESLEDGSGTDASFAFRSLEILRDWWIPSRDASTAAAAAMGLRRAIIKEIGVHLYAFRRLLEPDLAPKYTPDYLAAFKERATAIEQVIGEADLISAIAIQLVNYDPRTATDSPDDVVSWAVIAALNERFADVLTLVIGRDPKATRATEIRRRVALPDDAAAKIRLLNAIARIPATDRELLLMLYQPGGYKVAKAKYGTGKTFDRRRDRAVDALVVLLPEIAVLPSRSPRRRAHRGPATR